MRDIVRLGDIAEIVAGQSPPGNTYNDKADGLPFFQGKAEFGDISPTAKKWCSAPTKIAQAGDILISVRAPVGPTNIADQRCCIGRGLAAIRPSPAVAERDFVLWFLKWVEPRLAARGQGSTFAAINRNDLGTLQVPLPSLDEQRRIVDILNHAASIRRLREEARAKAREIIPALFVEMFGDPATNPKGWPVSRLDVVVSFVSGATPSKQEARYWADGTPWVSAKDMKADPIVSTKDEVLTLPLLKPTLN